MNKKKGRSIELFFVDGDPDGMLTATIPFQWTGHVLVANRTQLKEALKRPETSRPGVYLLIGENENGPLLYIGESDDIGKRIKKHDSKKDWWSKAYFITSHADIPLSKAHIRYLEGRLIEKANAVNKIILDNGNNPSASRLVEAAEAHMEDFLDNIFLVLPALRVDYFLEDTRGTEELIEGQSDSNFPAFILDASKLNILAKAHVEENNFVVEKGSQAREKWVGDASKDSGYAKIYQNLVDRKILVDQDGVKVFTNSYKFNSPSAAASVVKGRMANGAKGWKLEGTSKSYKDWEMDELDKEGQG